VIVEPSEKLSSYRKRSGSCTHKRAFHGLSAPLSYLRYVNNFDFSEGSVGIAQIVQSQKHLSNDATREYQTHKIATSWSKRERVGGVSTACRWFDQNKMV